MQNEPSQVIDKLLYALFNDGSQNDSVLLQRSNHLATLVPGLMQQFLRDYEIDTNTIARQQQLLKNVAQNSTYVNSYLLDTYNNEGITPLYAWLASTTSDSTQMLSDSLSDNIINTALQYYGDAVASQQADQQQIDKSQAGIYAFANWWQGASDYITTISPDLLGSISYDSDPALAVNNYLNSSNGDINKLHEAVAASSDGAPNLQRIASLLQVNLSPTNMTSPYVDVLKTQQMRLAEQPIYGSSRVGVASYWPGQYDAVWDYTTGTQDTLRLLGIKPWYSATLEGYKPAGSTEPYDNSSLGLASAAHLLGQKSYELSNHLGNVQATLSDKRYVQKQYYTASDSLRKGYAASVSSLYDYYPFGMLMKERCTSDTATQSVYMSQVVYSPQYTTVNNTMTGASITTIGTAAQTNYNGSISYTGTTAGIKKVLSNLIPNVPVRMKIKVLYNYKPLYIAVGEASAATPNSYTNLLYSTMSNGSINFTFTPTQTNVELSIKEAALTPSIFATSHLCFTIDSVNYTQQNGSTSSTQLVQISSKQSDKYRFGFNGQEKDNEIAGVGNHNTAEFWEYDTRVGRRWNVDPLVKPWESSYSCFANNPLWFMDLDGADTVNASKNPGTGKWEHTKTIIAKGNDVFNITYGKYSQQYIFSEGESGKRMSVLNLESNDDYTLGLYHISGSVEEGSTGFTVTPGGAASAKNGSGKRLPDDTYSLSGTGNGKDQSGYKWVQPLLFKGESNGNVGGRGVKIHPAASKSQKTQASLWTEGCYVVSTDYSLSGGRIYYDSKVSIKTSNQINKMLGATKDYNSVGNKNRPGSDFGKGIQFKLIQKSGFKKY